jgi:release factor glutamine methyltransferase
VSDAANNVHALLSAAASRLAAAGVEEPRRDARLLLADALGVDSGALLTMDTLGGEEQGARRFAAMVARRERREPFAYIAGLKGFWDLSFAVGPGVLIPRPETEMLIEAALRGFADNTQKLAMLDMGVGSGCLLLTLLHLYPNAHGTGVDRSADALYWAGRNADRLALAARCAWVHGEWGDAPAGPFDLIVSNPPYIASGMLARLEPELGFEPAMALDGGAQGLDAYRALAPQISRRLSRGGLALIEIGQGQERQVPSILADAGLETIACSADLQGVPRCVTARLALD